MANEGLYIPNWLVLSDEQMRKNLPFSPLNDEQMSNWLGVEHLPAKDPFVCPIGKGLYTPTFPFFSDGIGTRKIL